MKITTATTALAATAGVLLGTDGAAAANARFCSSQSDICYSEFNAEGLKNMNVVYRIATPQAAQAAPYDITFQIVASRNMGWAALSWGGTMVGHPLTVAWPNGNSVTVTSRMANGHTYPNVYSGATYTILPDTGVNGTHWTLSAICHGCSQWSTGSKKSISPYSTSVQLAYAMNSNQGVVTTPSNPASQFTYHDVFNYFRIDYNAARDPNVEVSS